MNAETEIMRAVREALCRVDGVRVWRNSVGFDAKNRIPYGLGVGSADLLGIAWGRALACEVKSRTGRLSAEQVAWRDNWIRLRGLYILARSADEALAQLEAQR